MMGDPLPNLVTVGPIDQELRWATLDFFNPESLRRCLNASQPC
ncbi:hypothetical protein GFS31_36630 [Leptolyngbya sp. BL0902]|nr:hypothetical protein GFS31_36630 [Leptolyngbya sp. BL0902]